MPRAPRNAPGGLVYHVLNRGVGRQTIFHKPGDYLAFERIVLEILREIPICVDPGVPAGGECSFL